MTNADTDRTQTPQAAAGVPDHSQPFLLAGKYHVPYLSLSFKETETRDRIGQKLQRISLWYGTLTTQEQLDRAEEFDAKNDAMTAEALTLWHKILKRRMGSEAPTQEEFEENVGPKDAEALMLWIEGEPGKATGESSPTGTTSLPD